MTIQGLASDALSGVNTITCNGAAAVISGTAFTCTVTLSPGSNNVSVTAADVAGNNTVSSLSLIYATPIGIQITSPTSLQLFGASPVTVTGTVSDPTASVTVGGVTATQGGGTFTAPGVILREGKNLLTASATTPAGGIGSDTVTVYLDTTPPSVYIDSPTAGAVVTSTQIDVTGDVNDMVTGTVNGDQVAVVVNGVNAVVANRTFVAHGVLLVPGTNTVTAVATDRAGNISQNQVHVTLQQLTGQTVSIISGNAQSAAIKTVLPEPLVVLATDALGRPMPNVALNFSVAKSDGLLISGQQQGRQLIIQTGTNGQASVQFQVGSRNGAGANQVAVTAPGFVGQVVFSADSSVGPPAQINTVTGQTQVGAVGVALAEPLTTIVFDGGGNPVAGVPVTFTVVSGGGLIGGQTTYTLNTDSDGKAYAVLVLGQQEGINNNLVTASFSGLTGQAASFVSSGVVPGLASQTVVSGIVLDDAEQPIANATASIQNTNLSALTNSQGQFTIASAPVGDIVLYVDGSTSTSSYTFPTLSFQMATIPGVNNTLGHPVYLPAIDTNNSQVVGGNQPVQLTMTGISGLVYTVAPNSVTFPDGTHVGTLTLSQVHGDRVPMTPPNGTAPRLVGTLQPAGVLFNPPIQIQLPNSDGLAPGQVVDLFSFHHDLEQFVVEGLARVSNDGSVVVSDPGYGLSVSGWHGSVGTPQAPTCGNGCNNPHNTCRQGSCAGGGCSFQNAPDGGSCDPGKFCQTGKCATGQCNGTEKPDLPPVPPTPSSQSVSVNLSKPFEEIEQILQTIIGPDAPNLEVKFSGTETNAQTCCEEQSNFVPLQGIQVGGEANITGKFPTPLAIQVGVVGNIGVFVDINAGLGGNLAETTNPCKNPQTTGSLTAQVQMGVSLDAQVVIRGQLLGAVVSGSSAITGGATGTPVAAGLDLKTKAAWEGLTASYTVTAINKIFSTTGSYQLLGPQELTNETIIAWPTF